MVVRVDFGEASFLFPGDLEGPAELDMVKNFAGTDILDVDVYQTGHHGSHTSSFNEFLDAMSPEIVVIPDGVPTRQHSTSAWAYGHPRAECIDRILPHLTRDRIPIDGAIANGVKDFTTVRVEKALYSTGWDGTILIEASDDGTLEVTTGH